MLASLKHTGPKKFAEALLFLGKWRPINPSQTDLPLRDAYGEKLVQTCCACRVLNLIEVQIHLQAGADHHRPAKISRGPITQSSANIDPVDSMSSRDGAFAD